MIPVAVLVPKTLSLNISISSSPFIPDIVISMDKGTNWTAAGCTEGSLDSVSISNTTPAVINFIYGGTNPAAAITMNGEWMRLKFEAGTNGNLFISDAKISQQLSGTNSVPGTTSNLYFYDSGGNDKLKILAGTSAWSDWVPNYPIERDGSGLVQFDLQTDSEVFNNARAWTNSSVDLSVVGGVTTKMIVGISAMEVRYPSKGLYRSGIFDTHIDDPVYRRLNWTQVEPYPKGDLDIRVRSGDLPDLSDTSPWLEVGYFQGNEDNNIASLQSGRYLQYEALFTIDSTGDDTGTHTNSAILRDITINWDAPTGIVDLQVDFGKGPDYGIVSATVDGQSFVKGLEIEMEIFKESVFGTNTATGIMEIRPLNTDK